MRKKLEAAGAIETAAAVRPRKTPANRRQLKTEIGCYLFLLPAIIGFFVFTAYPVFSSLFYSLTDFNGIFFTKIGFSNFVKLFSSQAGGLFPDIWHSFKVTFVWALISIPLGQVLSFSLALFVRKEIRGVGIYRLLFYLPVIIPGIAASFIWADVFSANGIANQFFLAMGLPASKFLEGESTAMATLILTGVWGIGGGMIMWLAALRNISPDLYEASSLDGGTYFTDLFRITIPLCTPMIFYNLITAIIAALQSFDVYAMVGTGPNDCLYFISIRIYKDAFGGGGQLGLACAEGWLLFAVIAALTALVFKSNKWVIYGEEG